MYFNSDVNENLFCNYGSAKSLFKARSAVVDSSSDRRCSAGDEGCGADAGNVGDGNSNANDAKGATAKSSVFCLHGQRNIEGKFVFKYYP